MKTLQLVNLENGVKRLSLNSGRGNPLTPQLISELNSTLDDLTLDPPAALVIDANESSIFSGGFALPIIADWPREKMRHFFGDFNEIMRKLLTLQSPVVAGIAGHAIAGGFILSLAADLRFIGMGKSKFGLSEVDLGVAVPSSARVLLGWRTTPQTALALSMSGQIMSVHEALQKGYATESVEQPEERAIAVAMQLAKKPGSGSAITRALAGQAIWNDMKAADEKDMDPFLDTWFSDAGQTAIHAMAKKLGKK